MKGSRSTKAKKKQPKPAGTEVVLVKTPDSREFIVLKEFENCLIEFCNFFNATMSISIAGSDVFPMNLDEFATAVSSDGITPPENTEPAKDIGRKLENLKKARIYMASKLKRDGEVSVHDVAGLFAGFTNKEIKKIFVTVSKKLDKAGYSCSIEDDMSLLVLN